MTTVSILPVPAAEGGTIYRAISGQRQGSGRTPGEALDAILSQDQSATVVVIKQNHSDPFFAGEQHARLEELMARWRAARDTGSAFEPEERRELEALVEAEVRASGQRAAAIADELER